MADMQDPQNPVTQPREIAPKTSYSFRGSGNYSTEAITNFQTPSLSTAPTRSIEQIRTDIRVLAQRQTSPITRIEDLSLTPQDHPGPVQDKLDILARAIRK